MLVLKLVLWIIDDVLDDSLQGQERDKSIAKACFKL